MIEINPFFFNSVFALEGKTMGLHYGISLGGRPASFAERDEDLPAEARECNYEKYKIGGCKKQKVWTEWINENFDADVDAFREQAAAAVAHLDGLCGGPGKWWGQRKK